MTDQSKERTAAEIYAAARARSREALAPVLKEMAEEQKARKASPQRVGGRFGREWYVSAAGW